TMTPGVCTIFHGAGAAPIFGTPWGRQLASDSSPAWDPSARASTSAFAQGWYGTSSGFMSAARFRRYFGGVGGSQIPERSGVPFGSFGAGAARFGFPLLCGTAAGGTFTNCAQAETHVRVRIVTKHPIVRRTLRFSLV